ncbi:MAG: hypothetical protein U0470_03010 [Anaerolineae bacterium]
MAQGETAKSAAAVEQLWDAWQAAGLDRRGHVVALGGALTDVAGFAAATYLRGVAWTAAPTTLLGIVDAAIGGKTAIDRPAGKNLAGAFHNPRRVIADTDALRTLPADVFADGLAEVVKAALIGDPALLTMLEAHVAAGYDPSAGAAGWPSDVLVDVIVRAIAVKAAIVARDPRARGRAAHPAEPRSHVRARHREGVGVRRAARAGGGRRARAGGAAGGARRRWRTGRCGAARGAGRPRPARRPPRRGRAGLRYRRRRAARGDGGGQEAWAPNCASCCRRPSGICGSWRA